MGGGQHPQFLDGVAKGALLPHQLLSLQGGGRFRLGQVFQGDPVFLQPLAVGMAAGQVVLEFLVADDAALFQADQEHPAGLEATALADILRGDVEDAGFGGHDQLVVLG